MTVTTQGYGSTAHAAALDLPSAALASACPAGVGLPIDNQHAAAVAMPSFGAFLHVLRLRRGMSRAELATRAERGASYITKLEQGHARGPSSKLVEDLAAALGATGVERQHLHDLSVYRPHHTDQPVPTVISDANKAYVDGLVPAISGFVDDTWNVLYANSEYRRVFRHIADPDVNNVLVWFFFVPESQRIMVEWEREALLTVSWLRALMVRGHFGEQTVEPLMTKLVQCPEFNTMWRRGDVALSRHKPEMLLRDMDRGRTLHLRAQVLKWPVVDSALQLYLGVDVGPPQTG